MLWTLEIAPGVYRDLNRIDPVQGGRIIKSLSTADPAEISDV
ncbi:MAG: hypothetical protein OXG24_01580 [Gammaproteobacteria bacterium]|nr:hypothetical protein [Gammaproteobacteria bacterium]